jgi:5-methylcytosine-specific restriction endonuclease McrA
LRRWISARDRTCRFPGCRRRAVACQVDHIDPWDDGGRTDADNLQALCTRHHQLKTHRGWRATRDPDTGRTHWTSPLGRTYLVGPEPLLVTAAGPPLEPDPPPF